MPRKTQRAKLVLNSEEKAQLLELSRSQSAMSREVMRAKILLRFESGEALKSISLGLGISRRIVYKHIDRALAGGIALALKDRYHGSLPTIPEEARIWVQSIACTKPTEHGYAAEMWTKSALVAHVRKSCVKAGHSSLAGVVKSTIHNILEKAEIRPHKIRYYLARKDPEFDRKMREVLVVYREVQQLIAQSQNPADPKVITISVDEKPGIQALGRVAPDLPPVPGEHAEVGRDYEYKRMGTASLLAGLDLQTGYLHARVERRHRSREFVQLLKGMDEYYPKDTVIRVILDNHSAHISKETMSYLATRPNRFRYVHTPKHGSWLNLVETVFSKMSRTFLKGIRVQSWEELTQRITLGVAEMNLAPVVHRWKNFEALDTAGEVPP